MKTFDNSGKLVGEINHVWTPDGTSIITNTQYYDGRPVSQSISIRETNGKVTLANALNGKLLP